MNKILILGGSGFIGNKLYRELNKFYKTFSTYNNNTKNKENSHFYYFRMEELNINILLNKVRLEEKKEKFENIVFFSLIK